MILKYIRNYTGYSVLSYMPKNKDEFKGNTSIAGSMSKGNRNQM